MDKSLRKKNFYEVLGVQKNCSSNEIKNSFIKLSKIYHPDRNADIKESHENFIILNEAYKTLINPVKRQKYDQLLNERRVIDFYGTFKNEDHNYNRNKYYTYNFGKEFYNLKTVCRRSFVITAIVLFFFIAGGIQLHTISSDLQNRRKMLDNKSKMASVMLQLSRRNAKLRGHEEQMRRLLNKSLNKFSMEEIMEEYERVNNSSKS